MYCSPRTEFAPKKRHQQADKSRALGDHLARLPQGIPDTRRRSFAPLVTCRLKVDLSGTHEGT